ncbi:MAG: glycosyltransferase, exosortase A system-associated [Sutterellaceae bacterium]|nr:glycosyltransferase, exosortase A system-associated [Burkholderiaceae bacterium]MDW8429332.1 glycosyltransferase, exosortase A system-associated [Sutterellaceae bacterium]
MRILHILDHSLPLHSGYAFRTLAILREQRALGWETLQLTSPRQGASDGQQEVVQGLTFARVPFRASWRSAAPTLGRYWDEMRLTARRIEELVRAHRPDILHAHSPVLNALPALRVGRRHGIPVVYEVRACWEDAAVDHGTTREGSLRYRATRALETWVARWADALTVICDGLRQEFVSRGIPPQKITVVPNGVDVDGFRVIETADEALRHALGLDGKTVLGFLGSFYAYEGLDLLLKAFAQIAAREENLRMVLVGGGPQEQALRGEAHRLGVSDRVVFAGRVPQAEISRYYSVVDVLVYPRRRMRLTELVTPLKPLEAMAQGKMLLASDVGGHRELVRDGDTGFLCVADCVDELVAGLQRVLRARDQWNEVRLRARRFVETERTWARSVANYHAVYARLVENSRSRRARSRRAAEWSAGE